MIISISGPSSTGKTTTIRKLIQRGEIGGFRNIICISESVRELFEKEYAHLANGPSDILKNKELTKDWTKSIARMCENELLPEILKNNSKDTLVVLDRCFIDHAIYAIINLIEFEDCAETLTYSLEKFLTDINIIDCMFVTQIPDDDYYEDDNFRPEEIKRKRKLEQLLFDAFFIRRATQLPYDIDKRIDLITDTVEQFQKR